MRRRAAESGREEMNCFGHSISYEIKRQLSISYNPQPDITAYELAIILPYLHGKPMFEEDWIDLGNAQRHLRRHD